MDQIKASIAKEATILASETDSKKIEEINTRIDRLIETKNSLRDKIIQDLDWKELLWIIFSFIIALLVFSSFKQSVTLSSSAVVNISLSFAFGFTFDRTLELATRLANFHNRFRTMTIGRSVWKYFMMLWSFYTEILENILLYRT